MGRSVVIFGSIPKSNFWCVFDVFLDLVILAYFNVISIHFYAVKCVISVYLYNFNVSKWEKAYIKDLNAWRFLMNFLCINLDEGRGGALMHVYVYIGTHNQPFLQNHFMDVYETWWRWSTHSHAPVYRIFGKLHPGAVPGQGSLPKIGQWGVPSTKDFFFRLEGYSNKPNIW